MNAILRELSRPLRTVLRWQTIATAALALLAGALAGAHGALSAAVGGLISMLAGSASARLVSKGGAASPAGVVAVALVAEGVRLGLTVLLAWVAWTTYREIVAPAALGTLVVTAVIFPMAFFVRDHSQ